VRIPEGVPVRREQEDGREGKEGRGRRERVIARSMNVHNLVDGHINLRFTVKGYNNNGNNY
jgi:hypothetical protein